MCCARPGGLLGKAYGSSSGHVLQDTPHWIISATLAAAFVPIWRSFDGTKGGAILAALLLAGAPIGACACCSSVQMGQKPMKERGNPFFHGVQKLSTDFYVWSGVGHNSDYF